MIAVWRNSFKSEKPNLKKENILQQTHSKWDINHKKYFSNKKRKRKNEKELSKDVWWIQKRRSNTK